MAEAHSAVAFSFSISRDGVDFNVDYEALRAVWESGVRAYKKRIARVQVCRISYFNNLLNLF